MNFLEKFRLKSQNYHLKLKFSTYNNSNRQNSMVIFIRSVFSQKYPFWGNSFQNVKIIFLTGNLVPRLIRICRIQQWCSLFSYSTRNPLFGEFPQKSQNYLFKLKSSTYSNSHMQNSIVIFILSVFNQK